MDIYLVEAIINGILLGGVLALLALGLNLIFGVIDVVWIAYADLVMCGMYAIYWLYAELGWPLPLACAVGIVGVAALGVLVHLLIIAPILGSAPINQLLATCLLSLQYDVHPFIGNTFGPLIFMICVLGGLGDMIGGFIAAFVISQIIAIGGYFTNTELSYVLAFTFFIVLMFVRPRGIFAR